MPNNTPTGMSGIRIIGRDSKEQTMEYIRMSIPTLAEMVFNAIVRDPIHQDLSWDLEVSEPGEGWTSIDWHHPLKGTN